VVFESKGLALRYFRTNELAWFGAADPGFLPNMGFVKERCNDVSGGFWARLWRRAHLLTALSWGHCCIGRVGCL